MSRLALVPILDSILGPHRRFGRGEHYYFCPFCHHHNPKLAVNVDNGRWHCWKCEKAGRTILSLVRRLDVPVSVRKELAGLLTDDIPKLPQDTTPVDIFRLPEQFISLSEPSRMPMIIRAKRYLESRGVRMADIERYNIGCCIEGLYTNRIIIPSYDANGPLNYFVGRDFTDAAPYKYRNPPISKNVIGFASHINWNHPVILVEGMLDAIAVRWNAIPLIGSTVSRKLREQLLTARVPVYLALDADALKKSISIAHMLLQENIPVRYVALDGKDPSQLGFTRMRQLIHAAQPMSLSSLISLRLSLV